MAEYLRDRCIPNAALHDRNALLHISNAPRDHLVASITRIITQNPPANPWPNLFMKKPALRGLFFGPTSIAYLLWTVHLTYPSLAIEHHAVLHWAKAYLDCGQDHVSFAPAPDDPRPLNVGISGEFLAWRIVRACVFQDKQSAEEALDAIASADIPPAENEWLRGRAGTLFLLRCLRTHDPAMAARTKPIEQKLIASMLEHDTPWTWNGTHYLGAVHGDIGNLTQIVLSNPSLAPQLEQRLSNLIDMQLPAGGYPTRDPVRPDKEEMLQVCHGVPGFLYSFLALKPYFPSLTQKIDQAAARGRDRIWELGLLRKEPCLCHGISGNGLLLEGEQRHHFMAQTTQEAINKAIQAGLYQPCDEPWGLLWGEAGRAWAWMCYDTGKVSFPGFSDV